MPEMTFTLPWPPAGLSPNARLHWAKVSKLKRQYRKACGEQAMVQGGKRLGVERLEARFTFYPPSRRRIDLDNCIASMKSGIDGLVDVLGVDDSRWEMAFAMAGEVGGMVKVEVLA